MTITNFSCPKCHPIESKDLLEFAQGIAAQTHDDFRGSGVCGEAVATALILAGLLVHARMPVILRDEPREFKSMDELLTTLRDLATKQVASEVENLKKGLN